MYSETHDILKIIKIPLNQNVDYFNFERAVFFFSAPAPPFFIMEAILAADTPTTFCQTSCHTPATCWALYLGLSLARTRCWRPASDLHRGQRWARPPPSPHAPTPPFGFWETDAAMRGQQQTGADADGGGVRMQAKDTVSSLPGEKKIEKQRNCFRTKLLKININILQLMQVHLYNNSLVFESFLTV